MSKDGASFVTKTALVIARPPDIKVKSTVGAGDAMVAGIITGHLRELPLAGCAQLATAFSIDALTRIESGITSPAAIDSSINQVAIEKAVGDSQLPVSGSV